MPTVILKQTTKHSLDDPLSHPLNNWVTKRSTGKKVSKIDQFSLFHGW